MGALRAKREGEGRTGEGGHEYDDMLGALDLMHIFG